jgi:hypothetical protein
MSAPHPAFAFGAQLRDQEFRRYLTDRGYQSGMPAVALSPESSWEDGRALVNGYDGPVLLARQADDAPHGWDLQLVE